MIGFSPLLPLALIGLFAGLALVVSAWGYQRLGGVVRRKYLWGLFVLRVLALVFIALLVSRPSITHTVPDPQDFRTLLLADTSGSMRVRDFGDQPRVELVSRIQQVLRENQDAFGLPGPAFGFSGETALLPAPLEKPTGLTALGDALQVVGGFEDLASCGAVLLVSDGIWNSGEDPLQAAKLLLEKDVPVSVVAAGRPVPPEDMSTRAVPMDASPAKGRPFNLAFTVESTFNAPHQVEAVLSRDGAQLDRRVVEFSAAGEEKTLVFEDTAYQAGVQVYRLGITPPAEDSIPENDVAFLAVEVSEPDVFRVAFLGGHLDWDFKMLRQSLENSGQFELSAMIRTGEDRFFRLGPAFGDDVPFPQSLEDLSAFEALVVQVSALDLMGEQGAQVLRDFVDKRGGGLLLTGGPLPADLMGLVPVRNLQADRPGGEKRLEVADPTVFSEGTAVSLYAAPGLRLPAGFPVTVARELKAAGRTAVGLTDQSGSVLSVQHYGSGRVAFHGFRGSWRWHLKGGDSQDRHRVFWEHLLVWLSSSSKPRLELPVNGRNVLTGRQIPVTARVLGPDYSAAADANVKLVVTKPDGQSVEKQLLPSLESRDLFEGLILPDEPGEYSLSLEAQLSNGEQLLSRASLVAGSAGTEMERLACREPLLRDVARITGGRFFRQTDLGELQRGIPLSSRVATIPQEVFPLESFWFMILLLAIFCAEWYGRRRIGLK